MYELSALMLAATLTAPASSALKKAAIVPVTTGTAISAAVGESFFVMTAASSSITVAKPSIASIVRSLPQTAVMAVSRY